jgi:hypothetical protein
MYGESAFPGRGVVRIRHPVRQIIEQLRFDDLLLGLGKATLFQVFIYFEFIGHDWPFVLGFRVPSYGLRVASSVLRVAG